MEWSDVQAGPSSFGGHTCPHTQKWKSHDRLGFHKVCARWVPHMLTPQHKMQRMGLALQHLSCYHDEGHDMLARIVTDDESCFKKLPFVRPLKGKDSCNTVSWAWDTETLVWTLVFTLMYLQSLDTVCPDTVCLVWKRPKHALPPVTVAALSKTWTVFAHSDSGIVGSNSIQGMDVWCVYTFILCLSCPVFRQRPCDELITRQRSSTVCEKWLRNWIRGQGPE
jgi:hypothetical protein